MYKVEVDPEAREQIGAMPAQALVALAEVMAVLEVAPWSGSPHHHGNPHGAVRRTVFSGQGMIIYLILEDQRRVDVLKVLWAG